MQDTHLLPGENGTVLGLVLERVPLADEEPLEIGRHGVRVLIRYVWLWLQEIQSWQASKTLNETVGKWNMALSALRDWISFARWLRLLPLIFSSYTILRSIPLRVLFD